MASLHVNKETELHGELGHASLRPRMRNPERRLNPPRHRVNRRHVRPLYPQGAALVVEAYSTTTLEGTLPGLDTKGKEFVASGDVGDAGWGSIDPTKYGAEKSPHVRMDV